MPTSGTTTYATSRTKIIALAMKSIGALSGSGTPNANEGVDVGDFLNMMLKGWQARADFAPGLKLWKRRRADLYFEEDTNSFSLGPSGGHWTETSYSRTLTAASPAADTTLTCSAITNATSGDYIGIELDSGDIHWTTINGAPSGSTITITTAIPTGDSAASGNYVFNYTTKAGRPDNLEAVVLRDVDGSDVQMRFMTMQEYMALPDKANTDTSGDPSAVYYEPQLTNGVLYLDVAGVADVTKKLHAVWLEPIEDMTAAADELDMPQVWYLPVVLGLSKLIAPMFGAVWTQEMEANYTMALVGARSAYPETETRYFEPGA
jgi:hypothetical protein